MQRTGCHTEVTTTEDHHGPEDLVCSYKRVEGSVTLFSIRSDQTSFSPGQVRRRPVVSSFVILLLLVVVNISWNRKFLHTHVYEKDCKDCCKTPPTPTWIDLNTSTPRVPLHRVSLDYPHLPSRVLILSLGDWGEDMRGGLWHHRGIFICVIVNFFLETSLLRSYSQILHFALYNSTFNQWQSSTVTSNLSPLQNSDLVEYLPDLPGVVFRVFRVLRLVPQEPLLLPRVRETHHPSVEVLRVLLLPVPRRRVVRVDPFLVRVYPLLLPVPWTSPSSIGPKVNGVSPCVNVNFRLVPSYNPLGRGS